MTVAVKICGVRSRADVEACARAPVDAIGFNFYAKSRRFITVAQAREWSALVPRSIERVGVFVETSAAEVVSICREVGLDAAQLHGDYGPEALEAFRGTSIAVVQVVRVRDRSSIPERPWGARVLLDSHVPGYGGAGASFDWAHAAEARRRWNLPVLLAGGLDSNNVGDAIKAVSPSGIDVASSVEDALGNKDPARIATLIEAVHNATSTRVP